MTNPLLQPDGRFRRESVLDTEGKNRFADDAPQPDADESANPLAPPSDAVEPAYRPRYDAILPHRGRMLAWLGGIGYLLSGLLLLALTGRIELVLLGLAASLVGIFLSLAAVVLGYRELSGMTAGAINPEGRPTALLGFRLGLAGVIMGTGAFFLVLGLFFRAILEW